MLSIKSNSHFYNNRTILLRKQFVWLGFASSGSFDSILTCLRQLITRSYCIYTQSNFNIDIKCLSACVRFIQCDFHGIDLAFAELSMISLLFESICYCSNAYINTSWSTSHLGKVESYSCLIFSSFLLRDR